MSKRKRKRENAGDLPVSEQAAEQNGNLGESSKLHFAVFGGKSRLHALKTACNRLHRIHEPGPEHVYKFITEVFDIAGVERP